MIGLRDVVEMEATPDRVFEWFRHLTENYRSWHPDHLSCTYLRGDALQSGSVVLVEEYLHGRLHRMRLKITDVQEGRGFTYRIFPGMGGRFRMEPGTRGTEFVAEMLIGWSLRGVSFLLDLLIRILFSRRFEALQEHMKEEGLNLRALLRAGSSAVRPA